MELADRLLVRPDDRLSAYADPVDERIEGSIMRRGAGPTVGDVTGLVDLARWIGDPA
ncbi:hypothetical protein [Solicola gregarius]|uniref:Uncharacterized protein n=1 Tax=Solicola gregarius TaxID=2908642 RepID=A0AA46TLX3_9ACTN|nr:hypothetical protein [Solicola gregarius]UYM07675.1 hypothetical protein L0C25_11570 [Solicola gregarius]